MAIPVAQAPQAAVANFALTHYVKAFCRISAVALPLIAIAAATVHAPMMALLLAGVTFLTSSQLAFVGFQNNWSPEVTGRYLKVAFIITGIVLGGVGPGLAVICVPEITLSLTARPVLAWYLESKYLGCCLFLASGSLEIARRALHFGWNLTSQRVQRHQAIFRPNGIFQKIEYFAAFLRVMTPQNNVDKLDYLLRLRNCLSARGNEDRWLENSTLFSLLDEVPADEKRACFLKILDNLIYKLPGNAALEFFNMAAQREPQLFQELVNTNLREFEDNLNPLRQAGDLLQQEIQEPQLLQAGRFAIHHTDLVQTYQIYKRYAARNPQAPQSLDDFNQLYQRSRNLRLQIDEMRRQRNGTDIDESESVRTVLLAYCHTAEEALGIQSTLKAYLNITSNDEIDERLRELGLSTVGDLFHKELLTRGEYVNKALLRERVLTALAEGTLNLRSLRAYPIISPINRAVSTLVYRVAILNAAVLPFWLAPQTSFLGVAAGFLLYGAFKFYKRKIASPDSRLVNRITRMYNGFPDFFKYLRSPSVYLGMSKRESQAFFIHNSIFNKGIELGTEMFYAYARALVVKTALKTSRVFYALPFLNGAFVGADLVDMIST